MGKSDFLQKTIQRLAEQSSDDVVMLKNDNVKGTEKKLLPLDKESTDKISSWEIWR